MLETVVGVTIFLVIVAATVAARLAEGKAFNCGSCSSCGRKWRRYDTDSQGGRGYTCDHCHRGTWISYRSVDRDFVN